MLQELLDLLQMCFAQSGIETIVFWIFPFECMRLALNTIDSKTDVGTGSQEWGQPSQADPGDHGTAIAFPQDGVDRHPERHCHVSD